MSPLQRRPAKQSGIRSPSPRSRDGDVAPTRGMAIAWTPTSVHVLCQHPDLKVHVIEALTGAPADDTAGEADVPRATPADQAP